MRALLIKGTAMLSLNLLVDITLTYSQTYFSKRINFFNENSNTYSFINFNDTLYVPIPILQIGDVFLAKVTINGDTLPTPRLKTGARKYIYPYAIKALNNSMYVSGPGGYYNTIQSPFFKFNTSGDTVKTTFIGDTTYYAQIQLMANSTTKNNQLVLVGATDSTCSTNHSSLFKLMVRCVDTNGVLIQTKLYTSCKVTGVTSVVKGDKNSYLIGYGTTLGTWDTESRVLKLDSNLNIVWDVAINNTSGGAPNIINHNDKYYMVISTKVDSVWNFTYKWERVSLTKLDLNGNIIWQRYYGVKKPYTQTSVLKQCANGDLLICGGQQDNSVEFLAYLLRTDSLGNIKWWRNYRPITAPIQDTTAENHIYDMLELANGDIIGVGWSGSRFLLPSQQTWLLKVDSNGCLGANNCPPNLAPPTALSQQYTPVGLTATLYPNPASNELTLSLSATTTTQLSITNMLGQTLHTEALQPTNHQAQLSIAHLPQGVYIVTLHNNGNSITKRLVISR